MADCKTHPIFRFEESSLYAGCEVSDGNLRHFFDGRDFTQKECSDLCGDDLKFVQLVLPYMTQSLGSLNGWGSAGLCHAEPEHPGPGLAGSSHPRDEVYFKKSPLVEDSIRTCRQLQAAGVPYEKPTPLLLESAKNLLTEAKKHLSVELFHPIEKELRDQISRGRISLQFLNVFGLQIAFALDVQIQKRDQIKREPKTYGLYNQYKDEVVLEPVFNLGLWKHQKDFIQFFENLPPNNYSGPLSSEFKNVVNGYFPYPGRVEKNHCLKVDFFGSMSVHDINRTYRNDQFFLGLTPDYSYGDGKQMMPLHFLVHDLIHAFNAIYSTYDVDRTQLSDSELKMTLKAASLDELRTVELIHFLMDHEFSNHDLRNLNITYKRCRELLTSSIKNVPERQILRFLSEHDLGALLPPEIVKSQDPAQIWSYIDLSSDQYCSLVIRPDSKL